MRYFTASLALAIALCACTGPAAPAIDSHEQSRTPVAPTASERTSAVADAEPAAISIPEQFQGEWNRNPEGCGTAMDDSRLRLGPDTIRYHESSGPIRAAVARGRRELALIVELSGEGETWLRTEHFRLSPSMDALSTVGGAGEPFVRYRCAPTTE